MTAAGALVFLWLGMVLAISFVEAPLKFRAPGVTIPIGLGIGRLVFRTLNLVEVALGAAIVVSLGVSAGSRPAASGLVALVVVVLAVQLGLVRPRLNRRSDRVLAGAELPRSGGHVAYVALELVKVIALATLGISLLAF